MAMVSPLQILQAKPVFFLQSEAQNFPVLHDISQFVEGSLLFCGSSIVFLRLTFLGLENFSFP